jgi:hypothetical protein
MALKVAYYNLKNMENIKSDVEHGRTHLGIALALSADGHLIEEAESYLKKISAITGLSDSPDEYYETTIGISQKNNYVTTLVPALREYGVFLAEKETVNGKDLAVEKLRSAEQTARESDMKDEVRKIKKAMKNLEHS